MISKKIIYKKKLKKGKFYLHNDNKGGHPSVIIDKKDNKNLYKALCFTHHKDYYHIKMKKNINSNDKRACYVSRYPIIDKRNSFRSKEWKNLKIHKDDRNLINKIKRRNANNYIIKKTRERSNAKT